MVELLLLLIAGHYLADFPLQGEFIAKMKGRPEAMGWHCLTAHAMIQGLVVAVMVAALGHAWVAAFLAVAVTHWLIDLGKVRGLYGINADQSLHILVLLIVAVIAQ